MFAVAAPMFTACDNGLEDYSEKMSFSMPSDKFNAKIQYVTRLTDGKLGASDADFTAINDYMVTTLQGKTKSWLTILDRADGSQSKLMQTALNTKRWTALAFNRIKNKTAYEGSMLFYNDCVMDVPGNACGAGCYVTGLKPKMAGTRTDKDEAGNIKGVTNIAFNIPFYTARFETQEQVAAFGGDVLRQMRYKNMNFLMVGTVKNELFDALQGAATGVAGNYVVARVKQGAAYSIFMLAEDRFWGFTEATSLPLGNGIDAYEINVMW